MAELLVLAEGRSMMLEEYARELIFQEELHVGEVDKMLRKPGDIFRDNIGVSRTTDNSQS